MTGYICKIHNDVNNNIYIGKTVQSIERSFKEHIKDSRKIETKNRPLHMAIRKYGEEHFFIDLVEECDLSILEDREQYWIQYYDSKLNGYNATLGETEHCYMITTKL